MSKNTWSSTWTYSYSQLSLYRLCPARYKERYVLAPPEEAQNEPVSLSQHYSATVIHPGIEAFHASSNTPFDLELSIQKFREHPDVSNLDTSWARNLADCILESYALNPIIPDPDYVEKAAFMKIDDIVTGEKNKWQWQSKPDFVNEYATYDLKFTLSKRPYSLEPYNDQMLGQAISWNRPKFVRYQIIVDKDSMKLKDIVVEEHLVDDLLRENWFQRTVKTMRDIEESHRTNLWTEHDHACHAFGKPCPYKPICVYGRVR